jgi:hypothetical protein
MGCFTLFCGISGLPCSIGYEYLQEQLDDENHPCHGLDIQTLNKDNAIKYNHLNKVRVVLPDSTISDIGYDESYGRVEIQNSDQIYNCYGNPYMEKEGIAISNTIYLLIKDDPRFHSLINNGLLYSKIEGMKKHIFNLEIAPYLKEYGAQCVIIGLENHIDPNDLWSYVDPFLIDNIDEPLLGNAINGEKSKILYQQIINKFLDSHQI